MNYDPVHLRTYDQNTVVDDGDEDLASGVFLYDEDIICTCDQDIFYCTQL